MAARLNTFKSITTCWAICKNVINDDDRIATTKGHDIRFRYTAEPDYQIISSTAVAVTFIHHYKTARSILSTEDIRDWMLTFCKRVWMVFVVFEPEAISGPEINKLLGYDVPKGLSKNRSFRWSLSDAGWKQVYIVHVSEKRRKYQVIRAYTVSTKSITIVIVISLSIVDKFNKIAVYFLL